MRWICCEVGRWIELAGDCVQWQALVLGALGTFCSAARELVSKMDLMEICCEVGRWIELAGDCVQSQALVLGALGTFCSAARELVSEMDML